MEAYKTMKEKLKKEIGLRMRKVRKALGYTQERIVAYFNIGRANYSRIEKGEVLPNGAVLNSLRTKFGVSLDWLITNNGTMFVPGCGPDAVQELEETASTQKIDFGEYGEEVQELLITMDKVSMVKHAVLGFFLEYKEKHKKVIQQKVGEILPPGKMGNNGNHDNNTIY